MMQKKIILATLAYYATGGFLTRVGHSVGPHKSTTSRIVKKVTDYLCSQAEHHIIFPTTDNEVRSTVQTFYQMRGFPRVLGCVDGTHVELLGPHEDEHHFVNRHHQHSLNVQVVCDGDLMFTDVDATRPGRAHDAYIFRNSHLGMAMEEGLLGNNIILGDSGYPLRPNLMTPLGNPATPQEEAYNRAHKTTRATVERAIGVLKSRFRCLHKTGGILYRSPEPASSIVLACCILHNICRRRRLEIPPNELLPVEDAADQHQEVEAGAVLGVGRGAEVRRNIVATF